jgi:SAM-dependent methyltransferase
MNGVNLIYDYTGGGPGKLIRNLTRGFDEAGVPYVHNNYDAKGNYYGILQTVGGIHDRKIHSALCGPNIFITPSDWGNSCKLYNHYIIPSQWVLDKYRKFPLLEHATIDVWAVGIDTEFWKKELPATTKRCLIYFKGRRGAELVSIANKLNSLKIEYDILEYGYYNDAILKGACYRCDFAVLLTGTESQGIGYMEILSMGLPCYVMNKTLWDYYPQYASSATSVPCFDSTCGMVIDNFDLSRLDEFVQKLDTYKPREFICNNYTLAQKARDYYRLLEKYDCRPPREKPMAHKEQRDYFLHVKSLFPDFFESKRVLDVGSLDVNGNNRHLFTGCEYIGIDIAEGKNVDQVALCHEYNAPPQSFDMIISNDCFEHDMYWQNSFSNIVRMLKPGGMFLFTCKTTGSGEHGTLRTDGGFSSPLTTQRVGWDTYYRNITEEDVRSVINIEDVFEAFDFSVEESCHDIRFCGIKK